MKRYAHCFLAGLAALAMLSLFVLAQACGKLPPVQWPKLVECAPGVSDVVGTVTRILLAGDGATMGDRAKVELNDLARDHGADTVACVVDRLVTDWSSPGASQDPSRAAAAARGRAFLAEVGTDPHLPDERGEEAW